VESGYSLATGVKTGLYATAYRSTDRLILEIVGQELYMHRRDEFEAGKSKRRIPLTVAENGATNLVAVDQGRIPGGTMVAVIMLNRVTGIGIWTQAESLYLISSPNYPRAEIIYLTCGARGD
jgi:hypothetical protein